MEKQIQAKLNYNVPYYGKLGDVMNFETEIDSIPYPRFFRGQYNSDKPIIFDRKAGFRVVNNYANTCRPKNVDTFVPDLCFSSASSVHYPCYPSYFYQYASTDERNNALNRYRVNTST